MSPQTKHSGAGVAMRAASAAQPPLQEWLDLVESALHGIHHSLNNRIGSLLAVVELQQSGGAVGGPGAPDGFAAEVERLQECNRVVRLLPDAAAGEEALDIRDVLADAVLIHQLLPSIKELPVIVGADAATPVRAERWALLRALTLLLRSAKSAAKARGVAAPSVHVSIDADESWVRVVFRFDASDSSTGDGIAAAPSRYAELLAERFGGATSVVSGAVELRVPTLKARRADDRR